LKLLYGIAGGQLFIGLEAAGLGDEFPKVNAPPGLHPGVWRRSRGKVAAYHDIQPGEQSA